MSAANPVPPIAAGVGTDLRAAREQAGWTLEQVAAALRIRLSYLEAMEEGRIGLLPGNAYAVAFMRSYAQVLGLDPEEILRRFRREAAEVNARTELEFPAPLPERGMPAGAIVVVGLVIAICGYAIWWHGGGAPAPAPRVAEVPAHLAAMVPPPRPPATRPAAADTTQAPGPALDANGGGSGASPGATAEASAASAPSEPGTPNGAASQDAGAGTAAPAQTANAVPAPRIPDVSPASALAATSPNSPAIALANSAAANTIVIGATADAWLEVRDPDGHVLLNKILHKGDTWTVPDQTGLELTTGNAGGTTVTVGKLVIPSLGGNGAVRRNLALDPSAIRAGSLAENITPQTTAAPKTND